jgi:hypothetical protein
MGMENVDVEVARPFSEGSKVKRLAPNVPVGTAQSDDHVPINPNSLIVSTGVAARSETVEAPMITPTTTDLSAVTFFKSAPLVISCANDGSWPPWCQRP